MITMNMEIRRLRNIRMSIIETVSKQSSDDIQEIAFNLRNYGLPVSEENVLEVLKLKGEIRI